MRTFNVFEAEFEYDDTDPAGYKSGNHRFGPKVGGQRLGATVYELPPGQSLCPYHYESEEEWLMVLQGEADGPPPRGRGADEAGRRDRLPGQPVRRAQGDQPRDARPYG